MNQLSINLIDQTKKNISTKNISIITGSQGFIGSHLYYAFSNHIPKTSFIGIDKAFNGLKQNYFLLDLLDVESLKYALSEYKVDYVFHNAALASVPHSYKDPMAFYENNVTATLNLIKVCKDQGLEKIIFASSSSVSGPSPYGHSKKIIEDILPKLNINYSVLRYFNVFGLGQRPNVLRLMLDAIRNDKTFTIYGNGETTRDFSYVTNVINANMKVLDPKYDSKILEVGTGESHTILELYNLIKNRVNPEHRKLVFENERPGDLRFSKANTFLMPYEITRFHDGLSKWLESEGISKRA